MAQITHGIRSVLSHPLVYSSFQSLMGGHRARQRFVADYVKPFSGMKVLDVGCGPADILAYLPHPVDYWGFDISEHYISQAREKFGTSGRFFCRELQASDLDDLPAFDVVLILGVLHHLDDAVAREVIGLAGNALKSGGRLLTIDPCLDSSQNFVARFLVRNDRGQNVRDKPGYEKLARAVFATPSVEVRQQRWIPYTHCIMECRS